MKRTRTSKYSFAIQSRLRLTIVVISLFSYSALSKAKSEGDTLFVFPDQTLNQVVVTGTRTPKTLANTPVLTRVITAQDIKRMDATDIKEVLTTELPGVEFSFSMNQQTSLTLQGMGGMSILFLVDGERMAGETLDNVDYHRLSLEDIERIEVVKGAATALYGSNAVGAVINIITKKPNKPWLLHLNTRLANRHDEHRHSGTLGFQVGRFNNQLNAQTDGFDSYSVFDADGDSTKVFGNRQINVRDKLTFRINEQSHLIARGEYYFHERDASTQSKDRARDFSAGLRYVGTITNRDRLEAGYSFDRYDKSNYYPDIHKEYLNYKNTQNIVRALYSHNFESMELTLGGDLTHDYLLSYQFSQDENHHDQIVTDAFGQGDWKINRHWDLVGGIRVDYYSRHGCELTPKITAMYSHGQLRVRGNYARGFRAPTLKEMYMNFNMANIFYIYGNEDLKSETSHNFSLGGEYTIDGYNLTLTSYYTILNDQITTLWNPTLDGGNGAMQYYNIEGTQTLGAEATLSALYSTGVKLKLSYAFFHDIPQGDLPHTATTRPHSLTAQVSYDKKIKKDYRIGVSLNGRYLSPVHFYTLNATYDGYQRTSSVGYTLWKLAFTQRFFDAVNITAGIDNLFGYVPKNYEFNSPYTEGRTFSVGAQVEIEQLVHKRNK